MDILTEVIESETHHDPVSPLPSRFTSPSPAPQTPTSTSSTPTATLSTINPNYYSFSPSPSSSSLGTSQNPSPLANPSPVAARGTSKLTLPRSPSIRPPTAASLELDSTLPAPEEPLPPPLPSSSQQTPHPPLQQRRSFLGLFS
jgi:hypothetical protein